MISKPLFVAAAILPALARAQAASVPPAPVHEEIVVAADRAAEPQDEAPAAVSTLSRGEIERLPAQNLGELVRYLPGFQLFFGGDFGGTPPMLTARGFFGGGDAEYVQVRIDGVPVGDPDSGIVDWRALPAERIDRIEAVRGAASPLYGDTALAGVIQVFTRAAAASGLALDASVSGGSRGASALSGQARLARDGTSLAGAGASARTDGFREHASEKNGSFGFAATRAADAGTFAFRVEGATKDRDDPGQLPLDTAREDPRRSDPLFRFDHESTDRLRGSLAFDRREGPVPFAVSVYGADRRTGLVRTLLVAPALGETAAQELRSTSAGLVADAQWSRATAAGELRFRGGAEASRDFVDSVYRAVGEDGVPGARDGAARGSRDRTGVFAAGDWDPVSRLRLTAGLRWDRIADDLSEPRVAQRHEAWSPQAGAVLFLGDRGSGAPSLFARYARAFKAATFDQQFDPRPFSDFQGGSFTISNPELAPQRARMVEGGIRVPWRAGRLEATAYRIDVEDEIDFDPASFRYRNIGRSRHVGVEAQGSWSWGSRLSGFGAYDWTRVESRTGEDRGKQLKNVPEHVLRAGVSVALPSAATAEAVWTWTGGRYLDDADRFRFSDVSVVDLRVGKWIGDFRVRLDVFNAADARYAEVGFTLADFQGGEVPYVYPAAGRTLRVGIDWKH